MEIEELGNGNATSCVYEEDTEEFSEEELASFMEQSKSRVGQNGGLSFSWARLVSVDKSYSSIELSEDEVSLGRADVVKSNGEEDLYISKAHCKIGRNHETGLCYIQNLSVNGTLVQGESIGKEHQVTLSQGDEISLGPQTSGCPLFVFQVLSRVQNGRQKRGIETVDSKNMSSQILQVDVDTGAFVSIEGSGKGSDAKKPKMIENVDTFKCGICLNVWHDVISVTPCLHSFCNSCFSDWYRKSCRDRCECICPQCRGNVSSVSRNHTLRSLVEDLLNEDPSLSRLPEDILEMDKNSLFKPGSETQFQFGRTRSSWIGDDVPDLHNSNWDADDTQNSALPSSDDEDEEYEGEEYGCAQCVSQGGNFQCSPGQGHLVCASCGRLYPERNDVENVVQKCQVCSKAYCRTYFESQQFTPFDSGRCPKILQLSQREVMDMPSRTHHNNIYEQEVTRRYIIEQGLTVQAVVRDWLGRLDTGEADQPPCFNLFQIRVSSDTAVCDFCADEVFAHLLERFRTAVPRTELPPDAAGRPDCWYGYECRTQHHKDAHARKLNHVCEPSRQSSRRSTAVQL